VCRTLQIPYGITDVARMKDPKVMQYEYFSPLSAAHLAAVSEAEELPVPHSWSGHYAKEKCFFPWQEPQ
jgi:hypothetical protein